MSHYEYTHPQPSRSSYSPKPKSKSKYSAAKIEGDLRKTLSFLSRTLQNEFLSPKPGQSHRSESSHGISGREVHGERAKGENMNFDEILVRGRKKLEKLVRMYKELNPNTSERDRHTEYEDRNDSGYGHRERSREGTSRNGRWQQADEIEEVESVRPSSRHRSSRNAPRAPSPPSPPPYTSHHGGSGHGYSSRDANDWAGVNPEYHSTSNSHSYPYSHPHTPTSEAPKRKSTGLSLDKINLPALIAHAGVILGIIERVLVMRAGGHGQGQRGAGSSTSGGGLQTAVKVVRMVVALTEGLGLAGNRMEDSGRRHTY